MQVSLSMNHAEQMVVAFHLEFLFENFPDISLVLGCVELFEGRVALVLYELLVFVVDGLALAVCLLLCFVVCSVLASVADGLPAQRVRHVRNEWGQLTICALVFLFRRPRI